MGIWNLTILNPDFLKVGFQMVFDKPIWLDFRWLGCWISDPIQNPDQLLPNLFLIIQKSSLVWISDPHCTCTRVKIFPDLSNFTYFVGVGAVIAADVAVVRVDLDVLVFIEMDWRFTIVKTLRWIDPIKIAIFNPTKKYNFWLIEHAKINNKTCLQQVPKPAEQVSSVL